MLEMQKSRIGRAAAQGATVVSSGLLLFGLAGTANAAPSLDSPTGGDKQQMQDKGSHDGDQNSLVGVDHNNIPIQACHNQIPVNVLGVQVPVQDVNAGVGAGLLGSEGKAPVATDESCHQPAGQQN